MMRELIRGFVMGRPGTFVLRCKRLPEQQTQRIALIFGYADEAPGEQLSMIRSSRGDADDPLDLVCRRSRSDELPRPSGSAGFKQ
jgi:hypothetical protein